MLNFSLPLKVALSLFVCNLLVVVTYISRILLHDRDGAGTTPEDASIVNDDDFTTRPIQSIPMCLTTVDLDIPIDCETTKVTEIIAAHTYGRVE